jgi:Rrf2 family protein
MNISSRCEYACRAMVELALHEASQETINSVAIAERRGIPEKYLVHILLQLKHAGLVRSIRGAQGGYQLCRPAEEISLLDIVQAIDGPILDPLPVQDSGSQDLQDAWREVAKGIEDALRVTTVRGLADKAAVNDMYYI